MVDVAAVIVTRGDRDLTEILESLQGFAEVVVWDNSKREDLKVYGRFAAIAETKSPYIYVQDDDCIVPTLELLEQYVPGERLCSMSRNRWADYPDSSLIGWGAIFPREDPERAWAQYPLPRDTEEFLLECDVVFTTLMPFRRIDVGHTDMPWATAPERMYHRPDHWENRRQVLERTRRIRDRDQRPSGRFAVQEPTISVIVPTVGRDTLAASLHSARDADEIVVVIDGEWQPQEPFSGNVRVLRVNGGDNGYTARTAGMAAATGTHLGFLDDDDVYAIGAIGAMRERACDRPVIFRMDHAQHGILWRQPELVFANVGTPMFLVPNRPDDLGVWAAHVPGLDEPGGDFTFIRGCVENMGSPLWDDRVVAIVRPHEREPLPTVAIVTPWLDHPELVDDYLTAMADGMPEELIVIDNGSTPPLGMPGIRLEENAGFSPASNLGLQAATADIVVFVNNDVALTKSGWLDTIRREVEPGVLVGAKMRWDSHGDVDGVKLPYLDGWCLAGMREDLLELGGWDETLEEPSYYGDNLLCLRARAAGMTLREVRVGLEHKGGRTSGMNSNTDPVSIANHSRFVKSAREILGQVAA